MISVRSNRWCHRAPWRARAALMMVAAGISAASPCVEGLGFQGGGARRGLCSGGVGGCRWATSLAVRAARRRRATAAAATPRQSFAPWRSGVFNLDLLRFALISASGGSGRWISASGARIWCLGADPGETPGRRGGHTEGGAFVRRLPCWRLRWDSSSSHPVQELR